MCRGATSVLKWVGLFSLLKKTIVFFQKRRKEKTKNEEVNIKFYFQLDVS